MSRGGGWRSVTPPRPRGRFSPRPGSCRRCCAAWRSAAERLGGGRAAGLARAGGGTARRPARPRRAGGLGPGPRARRRNWRWLGVEAAAAALADKGPDEALSRVWESMPERAPTPGLRPCGPPATRTRGQSLGRWRSSPRPARSIDQVAELKVSLAGARPPIWRRVGLPATASLADLHETIQVLFSWDGDHLHVFAVGKKQYGDPFADLEGPGTMGRSGCRTPWRGAPGRSPTRMTSAPAGSTRSHWRRRLSVTRGGTTRSVSSSRAAHRSSTGPRTSRKSPGRSAWPRSTAGCTPSARRGDRSCRLGSPHVTGVSRSQTEEAQEVAAAQASRAISRLAAGERGGTWTLRAEHQSQAPDRRVLRVT